MFGLFKQNNKEEEIASSEYLALVTKWDAFLKKIETRFNESLAHAEEAVLDNLKESDYDMQSTMLAWTGIKSQLQDLSKRINDVFDNTVEPKMAEYREQWDLIVEKEKGVELAESFYPRIERFEIILEGKVGQKVYDNAIRYLNEIFKCTQCSAKLEIKKDIFRSHYVSCGYCNTVNTFTPSTKISQAGWVIDFIAKNNAIEEWDEVVESENELRNLRVPSADEDKTEYTRAFAKLEKATKTYWTRLLNERNALEITRKEHFEADLDSKMKDLYARRKRELNF